MDERAVTELRRLTELDAGLAERAATLSALDEEVAAIRRRAEALDAFFAVYPAEETRRRSQLEDARSELARRRDQLAQAERALESSHDDEARAHAKHAVARALDHIVVAESRIVRAQAAHDDLERDAASLPRELDELETRARAVPDVPQTAGSLVDWTSHAHAALFVASGQIDVQRERVIREANELASMLLGEPTYGATVAQALARVLRAAVKR